MATEIFMRAARNTFQHRYVLYMVHKCILKAKNKQKCSAFQKKTEKGIHFL
jgi:hypothetical protein